MCALGPEREPSPIFNQAETSELKQRPCTIRVFKLPNAGIKNFAMMQHFPAGRRCWCFSSLKHGLSSLGIQFEADSANSSGSLAGSSAAGRLRNPTIYWGVLTNSEVSLVGGGQCAVNT